jgi:hypothetical protein
MINTYNDLMFLFARNSYMRANSLLNSEEQPNNETHSVPSPGTPRSRFFKLVPERTGP